MHDQARAFVRELLALERHELMQRAAGAIFKQQLHALLDDLEACPAREDVTPEQ